MELVLVTVTMKKQRYVGTRRQRTIVMRAGQMLLAEFDLNRLFQRQPPLPRDLEDCGYALNAVQDRLAGSSYWADTNLGAELRSDLVLTLASVEQAVKKADLHSTGERVRDIASVLRSVDQP
jgi:hypothetical protein